MIHSTKKRINHNLDTGKTELNENSLLNANDAILQTQQQREKKNETIYFLKNLFCILQILQINLAAFVAEQLE